MSAISKITSSSFVQSASTKFNNFCSSVGDKVFKAYEKSPGKDSFISKALKTTEPLGSNNSFVVMASLMLGTVIVSRVLTASKRNPDNKEATKDEIAEILFRDGWTVAIILLALKMMNSLIAGKATKISGIPMTTKPYAKLFETEEKGLKGVAAKAKEFAGAPLEKLKIIGKNALDTIHPTGGVKALADHEYVSKYSGYDSIEKIEKFIDSIPAAGGDQKKVFDKIMDAVIKGQEEALEGTKKIEGLRSLAVKTGNAGNIREQITCAENIQRAFEELKQSGYNKTNLENLNKDAQGVLFKFFEDADNALVHNLQTLNAVLRTIALTIESAFLGFGLPALNQKRLEKKYLGKEPDFKGTMDAHKKASGALIDKTIKPQEIKVFNKFLK